LAGAEIYNTLYNSNKPADPLSAPPLGGDASGRPALTIFPVHSSAAASIR
jgi:hypothetical protein